MSSAWVPFEPILDDIAADLASGELVHDENFSLFDAMSALEIGDAKMDAGARTTRVTLDDVLADGRAPVDITGHALVRELDAMLACEGTFRRGHAAATTTGTSAYCAGRARGHLDGERCHLALRAFTTATVVSAAMARWVVIAGDVYEEEDFSTQSGEAEAEAENAPDVDDAEDEVLIEIARALDALPEDEGMSERERDAVRARLEFRRSHHEMMKVLARAVGKATDDVARRAETFGAEAKARLVEMKKYYSEETTDESASETLGWDPDAGSFCKEMSLHMLGGAPKREVHFLSIRGAFEFFEKEIDDVLIAAEVFQYRARGSVPVIQEILDSLERLQAARPGAVALAIAAAELLHDKKLCGWHIGQVGLQSVWKFVDVDVDTLEESFVHPREAVDKFLYECIQPLTIVVRTFCVNRTRLRRVLKRALGELSHLQLACDAFDLAQDESLAKPSDEKNLASLRSLQTPCMAWAEHLTAYAQLRHLELGFSLDLYLPHELPMVYYYTQYLHQLLMAETKRKVFDPAKRTATTQYVYAAQQVKLSMYSALRFTYAALIERGKLRRCITAFSSEELRFWQRFSAFQSVELPPYLVYEDYKASIDANLEHFGPDDVSEPAREADVYAEIAAKFYDEVRKLAAFIGQPCVVESAEPARAALAPAVARAAKIAGKNAVTLRLLLTTDMECDVDTRTHDVYAAITARKPTQKP